MKKYLIIFLLLALSADLIGQETSPKGYIGFLAGPSIPYGQFAGTGEFYQGYAETGLNINLLNFGYKFGRNLGITAAWTGAAYPIDYFGENGIWGVGTLMIGPMFSLPLNQKFDLDFKGMIAYTLVTKQMDGGSTSSATGPGFDFGMMLHYNFSERWGLLLNLDAFTTQVDIQEGKDPKVTAFNVLFGIAYRLK